MLFSSFSERIHNSASQHLENICTIELDRIAHNLYRKLVPKADPPKKLLEKVNSAVFKYFVVPHLVICGGALLKRNPNSPLHIIEFSDSATFAAVFQSLKGFGVFNPMEREWENGVKKFIVVSQKYKSVWRFSETMGSLSIVFYTQGFNRFQIPFNDLPL